MKAVTAAQLSMASHGVYSVTLDEAIEAMRLTAADMSVKYKETSLSVSFSHLSDLNQNHPAHKAKNVIFLISFRTILFFDIPYIFDDFGAPVTMDSILFAPLAGGVTRT